MPGVPVGGPGLPAAVGRIPVNLQAAGLSLGACVVALWLRLRFRFRRRPDPGAAAGPSPVLAAPSPPSWNRSRQAIFTPLPASVLPSPAAIVISQSVISPVSGSAATCPRNPSRRFDFDLRV